MLAEDIAKFAANASYSHYSSQSIKEAKRRIIDTLGVCYPALNSPPVRAAREVAGFTTSRYGATVLGLWKKSSVQEACFANGCAARYLDFNDTYLSKEAMHPSDNIPAVLAAAEAEKAGGRDLILGTLVAYDLACALADASSIRDRGWDHVVYIAISAAVGAAVAMGMEEDSILQAVNLAATPNIALRQTRAGELSMWKGCAAANAARNGLFAALLAKNGMTGPSPVFEGEMGFFKQVSGGFKLALGQNEMLRMTHIKNYPVEYHAMSAVDAALKVKAEIGDEEISEVCIETFTVAWKIIAKDKEKWAPRTKETADHSLPYIVVSALLDGSVSLNTFLDWKFSDKKALKLMKRTKVVVAPEFDKRYPKEIPNRVSVVTKSGRKAQAEVGYPKGHFKNPMSDEEVEDKFLLMGGPKDALYMLWNTDKLMVEDLVGALGRVHGR